MTIAVNRNLKGKESERNETQNEILFHSFHGLMNSSV